MQRVRLVLLRGSLHLQLLCYIVSLCCDMTVLAAHIIEVGEVGKGITLACCVRSSVMDVSHISGE